MKPQWPREKTVERTIHAALEKYAMSVEPVARGRWACVFANGTEVCVGAHVADNWLLLDAPLEARLAPLLQGAAGFAQEHSPTALGARKLIPPTPFSWEEKGAGMKNIPFSGPPLFPREGVGGEFRSAGASREFLGKAGAAGAERDSYLRASDLLRRNATLAGGVKFAVLPQAPQTRLRAEVPLDEEVDVGRRVRQACAGFKAAASAVAGSTHIAPAAHHLASSADAADDGGAAVDLRCLCSATQWPFIERDATTVAVDLEVPGGFRQAMVEATDSGGVVASVGLATCAELASPPCQAAWGLLLLRACGVVRMARAAVHAGDGGALTSRFEVVFADAPAPAELAHAFATLSVACRLVDREAGVLTHDAAVATEYLRRWNTNGAQQSNQPTAEY